MDEIIDKIYLTLAIVFILTSTLFFSGCFESGEQRYAKGEIEVVFKENVTKNEAREIVYSFNCTPQEWWGPDTHTGDYWEAIVNVTVGEEKKYVRLFENHTAVDFASRMEIAY
ncbi:MAG: hypothetical protein ACOC40_01560 [Thermoplasmatota archaeon]